MMSRVVLSFLIIVFALAGTVGAQVQVSLVSITNVLHDSVLSGGTGHVLTIKYDLSGAPAGRGYLAANGWKIYSPDGADWEYVQGTALAGFLDIGWDHTFVNHFNKSGGTGNFGLPQASGGGNVSGNDTVAVLLAGINAQPGGGLPGGFDNYVFNIEFGAAREDAGLHICLDTCQSAPGAAWEWAHVDGLIEPEWSGVQCWVIGCCAGRVGDVNALGGDEPTIGDISALIDLLFISGARPDCLEESDVNLSGTQIAPPLDWDDITIGDISMLIDYIFISQPTLPDCP